jgi:Holliday junction DNA helicase RuvA
MITYLQGTLVEKQPTRVVLDVGGVGYEVFVPLSSYDRLPHTDAPCRLLTVDHVREDVHQLFGFATERERRMFGLLMSISGIGPKLAMSALSGLSIRDLTRAIVESDVKRLSSISGLGKKTAERIVVELRDKIGEAEALDAVAGVDELSGEDTQRRDAVLALVALGYKQADAARMVAAALKNTGHDVSVESIIKNALGG